MLNLLVQSDHWALKGPVSKRWRYSCVRHDGVGATGRIAPLALKLGAGWRWSSSRSDRFASRETGSDSNSVGHSVTIRAGVGPLDKRCVFCLCRGSVFCRKVRCAIYCVPITGLLCLDALVLVHVPRVAAPTNNLSVRFLWSDGAVEVLSSDKLYKAEDSLRTGADRRRRRTSVRVHSECVRC
jgi:hypothetical protein